VKNVVNSTYCYLESSLLSQMLYEKPYQYLKKEIYLWTSSNLSFSLTFVGYMFVACALLALISW
ncbi:hypothetical protein, partial [Oceanobacillus saliphilus]|uniref:hypothetical protein n=1 Tax=Oceanobacillus saliphilus TaxID=2925834 RepID=UPI00201D3BBC